MSKSVNDADIYDDEDIDNDDDFKDNDVIAIITKLPNMSTLELTRRIPSILENQVKTKEFHKEVFD